MGKCPNCHGTDVRLIRFHPQHPSSCVEQNQGFCCFKCIEFYMIKEDLPSGDITPLDRKRSTDSYRCGCCCHGYEDKIRISRAIMAELKETLPINIKGINDLQSYSPRVFANSHHDDIEKIMSIDKWDKSQYVNSCQVEEDMNVERGDSDNNNNDVAARGNATNNNPAPGDQDGGSESGAADNDSGGGGGAAAAAGVSAANEDTAANEQHEDGESRAANNINAAAAGGTVAIANENSAANERHDDDGFVANNINAAGGTSVMLSVQVSTSSDRFHHSFNRYLSSEVLAQRDPFTFELGGFVVTFGPRRSRPPPPRDNEGGRNVRRRIGSEHMYAAARGPGDQDGGSGSDAADNNAAAAAAAAAAGVSAANEDSAANEQHEDGESRAANNINAAAAGGTVAIANENSAANERHDDDGFVANNINAAGGTSVMLSVQVSTSSDRFHHSFNRYLSSEVLAQRDPFTFELGGFVVTFGPRRSRPPPPRDNEGGRNVRRRIGSEHMYAAARGPGDQDGGSGSDAADNNAAAAAAAAAAGVSAANEDSAANEQHEDTEERTSRRGWQLPTSRNRQTSQNRQNRSAADGRPDWVALPVPAGQSQTCPFCEGNIFEDYRNVLPIFDKCIEINGTDATRRGIFRWHSSLTVQDGDRQYHCWPYGVLTTRGLCETIETSLTNRISMNERETTDLIRYLFVGLSFFDVSNFHVFMDDLFASLEQGTIYRNSSDEAMISEYILHWGSMLEAANNHRSNLVRTVRSGRFDRFLGERTRREVGDIIDDVRQSVSLLKDQVDEYDRQEQDDEASASSHLENIVNTWFSSSVISTDAISDIMKLSLSKAIFHRLDSIRKTSEMWRNRRH